tara:strand:- start:355 stop:711 length:357 start_codon:yes stop_codon:yes gene_type:complete
MNSQKISCSPVDKNVLNSYIFNKNNDQKELNELSEKKNNLKIKFEEAYFKLNYNKLYDDPIFARSMIGNNKNDNKDFTKQKQNENYVIDYNVICNDPILARAMQHNLTTFIDYEKINN